MTNFPNSLDSFTNPTEFDQTNSAGVPHYAQHANANDAIAAIEAFLISGTGPSGGADWRFKLVAGVLQFQGKDDSGGGTPWHRIYITQIEGSWVLVPDQTGQAT